MQGKSHTRIATGMVWGCGLILAGCLGVAPVLAQHHNEHDPRALAEDPRLAAGQLSPVLEGTGDHHHKVTLERLLRLYPCTPAPVVYLLAGCPPARATLHLRQLSLLGMVARLGPTSILHKLGVHILNNPPQQSRSPSSK